MALSYKTDDRADDRLNPADPSSDMYTDKPLDAREQAQWDQIEAGYRDDNARSQSSNQTAQDTLKQRENTAQNLYSPRQSKKQNKITSTLKKRGGILGGLAIFGFGASFLGGTFAFFTMLIGLTSNLNLHNDSASPVMERRFMRVFKHMTNPDLCKAHKVKCKMGRISNHALRKLSKKGVVAHTANGERMDTKRIGYPEKNPAFYTIDKGDGKPPINVKAKDLTGYLTQSENRELAAKVLGRAGAFNMRFRAWRGKYIKKKFYNVFRLNRNGNALSKLKGSAKERLAKYKESIPKLSEKASGITGKVKSKVEANLGKLKKGGTAYFIAASSCTAAKLPQYIAAGVAAVQLAQLMPFVMDFILSPGSKAKAAGDGSGFSAKDAEAAGNILTERTKDNDGNVGSALDSAILLAAIGVNKGKVGLSKKYAPGNGALNNKLVKASKKVTDASETECNAILSPAAMYSAMTASVVASVATGGLLGLIANWVVSEIVGEITKDLLGETVEKAITEIAKNDDLPKARGRELGDVLGTSAAAFFSSGSMARHIPVLRRNDVKAFNNIKAENEKFQREMDIASLSPFDTSSQYTFLGSIVSSMQNTMLASGTYNTSLASMASNLFRLPAMALSPSTAGAAVGFNQQYCNYASNFGLETVVDGRDATPGINMAGLPCTGITPGQDAMSTEEAIDILAREGWINPDADVPDGATVDELIGSYIKEDSPLADYITSCSDASSGDYLFSAAGCMVDDGSNDLLKRKVKTECVNKGEGKSVCSSDTLKDGAGENDAPLKNPEKLKDARAVSAMSVFLVDFQIAQSTNGEDEEGDEQTTPQSGTPGNPSNLKESMYYQVEDPWKSQRYGSGSINECGCGPTSVASIISALNPDKKVTPKQMADTFVQLKGQLPDCGSKWIWQDQSHYFKNNYGVTFEKVQPSADNATRGLDQGGLVLISVRQKTPFTNGGHILVIRGKTSDGNFLVGDPASRKRTTSDEGFKPGQFYFGQDSGTRGMWIVKRAN